MPAESAKTRGAEAQARPAALKVQLGEVYGFKDRQWRRGPCSRLLKAGMHRISYISEKPFSKLELQKEGHVSNSEGKLPSVARFIDLEGRSNPKFPNCEFRLTFVFKRSCAPFVARNLV